MLPETPEDQNLDVATEDPIPEPQAESTPKRLSKKPNAKSGLKAKARATADTKGKGKAVAEVNPDPEVRADSALSKATKRKRAEPDLGSLKPKPTAPNPARPRPKPTIPEPEPLVHDPDFSFSAPDSSFLVSGGAILGIDSPFMNFNSKQVNSVLVPPASENPFGKQLTVYKFISKDIHSITNTFQG
jgi:hypothetical protein